MKSFSNPNDLVLDPFLGGGTTLAVAKDLKRRCIGIEIDPQYMDVIKSRLLKADETKK
jgi:DNA modification methylase